MKHIFLFSLLIALVSCEKKETYRFEIKEDNGFSKYGPISLEIAGLSPEAVKGFSLFRDDQPIPFQIDGARIWFAHNGSKDAVYRMEKVAGADSGKTVLRTQQENGDLQLQVASRPQVTYRYGMTDPPNGVDPRYRKSGYIHPITTPKGDTLTSIQPQDHYHHYGLWGPWTHTRIDSTRVDFWNLGEGQGTVLFKEFKQQTSGNVFAGFVAAQEHIDFITQNAPQVALQEELELRLWNLNHPQRYLLDYTSRFSSPLENGILFESYRYGGGIGLRFTENWKADNCSVLTSEGQDRLTADGTKARWCIVSGASSDKAKMGILFMSHPKNRMHPEPMRIWPIDSNQGRGDMFFEFCPIRYHEWNIRPNTKYALRYRMVVFDGELSAQEAEAYWQAFSHETEIRINSN